MHVMRGGSSAADIAALDPDCIGYAQLNDTTMRPRLDNYMEEAMFERMVPGDGDLPLLDILSALPRDIIVEIEVPRRSLALAGVSPDRSDAAVRRRRSSPIDRNRTVTGAPSGTQLGWRSGSPAAR